MKERIKNAIQKFDLDNFYESSLNFFNSLGYDSDKRSKLKIPDYDNFVEFFPPYSDTLQIDKIKAKVSEWNEIQFLMQLTDDDINDSEQLSMFHSNKVDTSKFWFFGIINGLQKNIQLFFCFKK